MQEKKVVFRKRRFKDAVDAWWWLKEHPMFEYPLRPRSKYLRGSLFGQALDIGYHKVDGTGTINRDESQNVNTEVWLECGPAYYEKHTHAWIPSHDYQLGCGGPTFEVAFMKLVKKVLKKYGDYEELPYSKAMLKKIDKMARDMRKGEED